MDFWLRMKLCYNCWLLGLLFLKKFMNRIAAEWWGNNILECDSKISSTVTQINRFEILLSVTI